jgi:hypothetical protein
MKRGIGLMKKNGYKQFYLNASPMGFKGFGTIDLVDFYKKFGFKELLNQGHNVLMCVNFNKQINETMKNTVIGYSHSPDEWVKIKKDFPDTLVEVVDEIK